MSKAFGLAGLRIGWLATRDKTFLESVASYKLYTTICNSAPSEILALIALRAKSTILNRAREIILANLQILDRFMDRHQTRLSWVRPEGGTMAVLKLLLPHPCRKICSRSCRKERSLDHTRQLFRPPRKLLSHRIWSEEHAIYS